MDGNALDLSRRELIKASVPAAMLTAGCSFGGGGGEQVELSVMVGNRSFYPDMMQRILADWEENLGIQSQLESIEFGAWIDRYLNSALGENWPAWYMGFGPSPERLDPTYFLSVFTSGHSINSFHMEDDAYDEAFQEYATTYDEERRQELMREMQTIQQELRPYTVGIYRPQLVPVNTARWDITPTQGASATIAARQTWMDAVPKTDVTTLLIGGLSRTNVPNQFAATGTEHYLFLYVFDPLKTLNTDGEFVNWAVESFDPIDDTTIDLTLVDGMTFHDGEDVTAEDLKFTLDFVSEYEIAIYESYVAPLESTEIIDDLTVRVSFEEPHPVFLTAGSAIISILPEHIWSDIVAETDDPEGYALSDDQWIGSGPWQVENKEAERMEFSVFDDYRQELAYDGAIWIYQPSTEAARANYEQENIHLPHLGFGLDIATRMAEPDHIEVVATPSTSNNGIGFDLSTAPTDELDFRRALTRGVDWSRVNELFYGDYAEPGDGTTVMPFYEGRRDDLPTLDELYDVEDARGLLEGLGYSWDGDGNLLYPSE